MKTHNCNFKKHVKRGSNCPDCGYALFNIYKCVNCPRTSMVKHVCRGPKKRR